jgi:hypothetical protein
MPIFLADGLMGSGFGGPARFGCSISFRPEIVRGVRCGVRVRAQSKLGRSFMLAETDPNMPSTTQQSLSLRVPKIAVKKVTTS